MNKLLSRKNVFLFFVVAFIISCGHIEPWHNGVVRDSETLQPLENVVVVNWFDQTCYFPPNPAGTDSEFLGLQETLSDNSGRYALSFRLYPLPPLLCLTDKYFFYFKPGYFLQSFDSHPTEVNLYRMKHYLNYLPYLSKRYSGLEYLKKSSLFLDALSEIRNLRLEQSGEKGVFYRLEGSKFTRIYRRKNKHRRNPQGTFYFVYNESSDSWIVLDIKGEIVEWPKSKIPKWDFLSSHYSLGIPIYASKDKIFYLADKNPKPVKYEKRGKTLYLVEEYSKSEGMKYRKKEIKFINPHKGEITGLAVSCFGFMTIEGGGSMLCHYGGSSEEKRNYNRKTQEKTHFRYFLNYLTGKSLPNPKYDDTIQFTVFRYIAQKDDRFYVVTQTPRYWHVYRLYTGYDEKINRSRLMIKEIASFPEKRDISAFTVANSIYIAFKDEGIRKYDFISDRTLKEDRSFYNNSKDVLHADFRSIAFGSAINTSAIYATAGDDKVYRFSLDGIPDYQIK